MIELGLQRIRQLVAHPSAPALSWPAIHVAGTNGKGSVVSFAASLLRHAGLRTGSFTSPHLEQRWDCVAVDERAVARADFIAAEREVRRLDAALGVGASEFELLAATAFRLFESAHVDVGVVEVGLGGRLDATNVLGAPRTGPVLATAVAKIGLDHQALLGETLPAIAREKAGIMKPGVPCVVDATNDAEVLRVLAECARQTGVSQFIPVGPTAGTDTVTAAEQELGLPAVYESLQLPPHQRANLAVATTAVQLALSSPLLRSRAPSSPPPPPPPPLRTILQPAARAAYPRAGRLQLLDLRPLLRRAAPVLLDGAHNPQSAQLHAWFEGGRGGGRRW
ncbi:folylpolyglutamate synthase [Ascosphaera acerosa]|nr:folylpolyglutamate synthase [Ascosphaera acerosa]